MAMPDSAQQGDGILATLCTSLGRLRPNILPVEDAVEPPFFNVQKPSIRQTYVQSSLVW